MPESFHLDADLTGAGEFDDGTGINLGASYMFAVDGQVTHVRFRSSALGAGSHAVALYQSTDDDPPVGSGTGTLLDDATVTGYAADAWVSQALDSPVAVNAMIPYRSVRWTSIGRYRALANFFSATPIDRGNIRALADNVVAGGFDLRNGTYYVDAALGYTRDSFNSTTYFTDIVFAPDYYRVRPFRDPGLSSSAGLYSFGMDVEVDTDTIFRGMYWYHPAGGVTGDVAARLYDLATQTLLASGSLLAASVVDGWNYIPYSVPYEGTSGVTYVGACETSGDHGYDNSVTLPQTDVSGHLTFINTRYENGGGFPFTEWGGGHHGIDMRYDFNVGGAPTDHDIEGLQVFTPPGVVSSSIERANGIDPSSINIGSMPLSAELQRVSDLYSDTILVPATPLLSEIQRFSDIDPGNLFLQASPVGSLAEKNFTVVSSILTYVPTAIVSSRAVEFDVQSLYLLLGVTSLGDEESLGDNLLGDIPLIGSWPVIYSQTAGPALTIDIAARSVTVDVANLGVTIQK